MKEQMPYRRCKYARYWRQVNNLASHGQTLLLIEHTTQPATQPTFSFQGCTFNNCTFQLPQVHDEDFSDVNIQEFLQFEHC